MIPPKTSLVKYDPPVPLNKLETVTKGILEPTASSVGALAGTSSGIVHSAGHVEMPRVDAQQECQQTEQILNSMFPPLEWIDEGHQSWVQRVSTSPATRLEVVKLEEELNTRLRQLHANETGLCSVREELYSQCFDELIRQVTINCTERGRLLLRVRDEMRMTIAAYQTWHEDIMAGDTTQQSVQRKVAREAEKRGLKKQLNGTKSQMITEYFSAKGVDLEKLDDDDVTNLRALQKNFKSAGDSVFDHQSTPIITKVAGNAQNRHGSNGSRYISTDEDLYVTMEDPSRHLQSQLCLDVKVDDAKELASHHVGGEKHGVNTSESNKVDCKDAEMSSNSSASRVHATHKHQLAPKPHHLKFNRQATVAAQTVELNMKDPLIRARCSNSDIGNPPPIPSRDNKPGNRLQRALPNTPDVLPRLEECESLVSSGNFNMAAETEGRQLSSLSENTIDCQPSLPPPLPSRHDSSMTNNEISTRPQLPIRKHSLEQRSKQLTRSVSFTAYQMQLSSSSHRQGPGYSSLHLGSSHLLTQEDLSTNDAGPPPLPSRRHSESVDMDSASLVPLHLPRPFTRNSSSSEPPPLPQRSGAAPALPPKATSCLPPPRPQSKKGQLAKNQDNKISETEHHDYFDIEDNSTECDNYVEI